MITERRQPAVDLVGRHDVLGHRVVDLVVRDEALLLAELDQLVFGAGRGVRVVVAAAFLAGAAFFGERGGIGIGRGATRTAAVFDLVFKGKYHGERFYKLLEHGRTIDDAIDIYSVIGHREKPLNTEYTVDALVGRLDSHRGRRGVDGEGRRA